MPLHSAFPTKTVVFLLLLGGLGYYFLDTLDPSWTDSVFDSYEADLSHATPLHFYNTKEELDHWIDFHIPDGGAALKNTDVLRLLSEQFDRLAYGWMMSAEDARKENMPVTHGCRLRSNEPCEDFYALGTSLGTGARPWNFWAVMDGHAGRHTALHLQWTLIPFVSSALSNLPTHANSMDVESTIKQTFLRIDKQLMDAARTAANWFPPGTAAAVAALTPAFSGSCALLATFDPEKDVLRVACTGDSRAVLGRFDTSTNTYNSIPLSIDQTGFNPLEVSRLAALHPDEPSIIDPKSGRLLGIAVTRAFGDHRWKWDNDFIRTVQHKFWGPAPREGNKTPPYMTAEPEVTETEVVRMEEGRKGSDFLIMASDGLWDRISSEHAVECVSRWLEAKSSGKLDEKYRLANPPVFNSPMTPDAGVSCDPEKGESVDWQATPEFFAIEDENAAVCLARNALGGTRRGLFTGVLSVPGPMGRYAVDDTTVMVVFFERVGDEQGKGKEKKVEAGMREKKSWWKPW